MSNTALRYTDYAHEQETQTGFSQIHANFSRTRDEGKTGADIIAVDYLLKPSQVSKAFPLWSARVQNVPLSVLLSYEAGHWFAEIDWLDLVGEGRSPKGAIEELENYMDHLIDYYSNESLENLAGFALELRDRFLMISRNN